MDAELLDLATHVDRLVAFCATACGPLPHWNGVALLDTSVPGIRRDADGVTAPRRALVPIAEFASRFDVLLRAGYPWINLSAYGVFREELIVGLEIPSYTGNVPIGRTSVNYSGVSLGTGWKLRLTLEP